MNSEFIEADIIETDEDDAAELPTGALIRQPTTSEPQPIALQAKDYAEVFMPSLSVEQAKERFELIRQAAAQLLVPGKDFGQIPGTDGNALLLAGAEKLAAFFGLSVHVWREEQILDRKNRFFLFRYKATVKKGGVVLAECDGECNSEEDCWKVWVKCEPPSESTAKLMIQEKRGKWTEWQGKREWSEKRDHPNPLTLLNNASKRAQKRAYVGAVKKALGISDLFAKPLATAQTR